MNIRPQRIAFMLLPTLDHFAHDLIAGLPSEAGPEVRAFHVRGMASLDEACAWANDPDRDVIWFEFCWPPFPAMIAGYDFGGRRVVIRVHRIEAYGSPHAATAPWHKIDDVIVVSTDMAAQLRKVAPMLDATTALHVVYNGVDVARFAGGEAAGFSRDAFRIGWCGLLNLRKNPNLALEILHQLRRVDARWHMHLCAKDGEDIALDSFWHLRHRMGLDDAAVIDGTVSAGDMPAWHRRNAVLLSTSVHESFGYAIAEAASCGCDIAVLDHIGGEEFWPAERRFGTTSEAVRMILEARPGRWRDLVTARFSLAEQIARLREILRPKVMDAAAIRVRVTDDLLAVMAGDCAGSIIRVDRRSNDEMEAVEFMLDSLGYEQAGKCRNGILYQTRSVAQ
jgi:glycosyltransferase involved in cell wall biosynthesis